MQFSVAAALALLTAAASAAPAADVVARAVSSVPITLTGVNPADTVTIYVGDNDQGFPISTFCPPPLPFPSRGLELT